MPAVDLDGHRIEYTDRGTGLPLVFVPGLYGSPAWFRYQSSGLSDRYRVIACDTRRARGRGDFSLALLADDLARFLDALKIHSAVVAGHTLGASITLQLAARRPERVLAAVTVSAAPDYRGISGEDVLLRLSPGEPERDSLLTRVMRRFGLRQNARADDANPLSYLVRNGGTVDKATLSARLHVLLDQDLSALAADLETPVLVVAGSGDWARLLSGSQALDQLTPTATLEVLEDAGHFCFFTRHDLFNATLDEFISNEVSCP